jgi:hypothetical protein
MAVTVKSITLWRKEVADQPGELGATLRPLADAKAELQVVMGYRYPGAPGKAAIELAPVSGKKAQAAAESAGLRASNFPALQVIGDDRPGLGRAFADAIAGAGINIDFLVAQVVGRKYSAIFGFANTADAQAAAGLIKKVANNKKK